MEGKIGLQRDPLDAYYTHPVIAKHLVEVVDTYSPLARFDFIVEPSAGGGAFSDLLPGCFAYDLHPGKRGIKKADYLTLSTDRFAKGRTLVIGNPPFGRQSTLARQFIQKSAEYASVIAFVLPMSYKKQSFRKHFPLHFHMVHQENLPPNAFLVEGHAHTVPCVFQIWERRDYPRAMRATEMPRHFTFVGPDEHPHFAIRRIGVYAGRLLAYSPSAMLSPSSHYFIRLNRGVSMQDFQKQYATLVFRFNNTVGPKSISKPELIRYVNRLEL